MEKTILIPIDFHIESLNTLKLALLNNQNTKVKAILMFAVKLDDSITDLLFYSESKMINNYMSTQFSEALLILKNSFSSQLIDCKVKLYHGNNTAALDNFLEANKVDEIFLPEKYTLKLSGYAFDVTKQIKRSNLSWHELGWTSKTREAEGDQLSNLFNN